MNFSAQRLWNCLLQTALATASLATWLAGSADADGITPPVAAAADAAPGTAAALDPNGAMSLGVQFFVGAVLLIAAACFAWLLYLMVTAPPEEDAGGTARSGAGREPDNRPGDADPGLGRLLGYRLRARLGARLGYPGPM